MSDWNSEMSNDTSPYISLNIDIGVGLILYLLPKVCKCDTVVCKVLEF